MIDATIFSLAMTLATTTSSLVMPVAVVPTMLAVTVAEQIAPMVLSQPATALSVDVPKKSLVKSRSVDKPKAETARGNLK